MSHTTPERDHVAEQVGGKDNSAILGTEDEKNGAPNEDEEDKSVYLHGWALKSLAMALMSSGFMLSLDDTILGMDLRVRKTMTHI